MYRMTSPAKESRVVSYSEYVRVANPIAPEKSVLRRSLVASVLDALEKNIRLGESLSLFEIGSIFEPVKNDLPNEWSRFAIAMTGLREATAWDVKASPKMDFYDLKGRLELLLSGLRLSNITYTEIDSVPYLHPGKAAEVKAGDKVIGAFGEMHPLVKEQYELGDSPVLIAEFDLESCAPSHRPTASRPSLRLRPFTKTSP